jgi:ADP-heptose:LPS heptosyltransferase
MSQRDGKSVTLDNNSKVLFIRLNRIGDALVTTPLLHLVKTKLNCKVYLLADIKNFFVFKNNPDVDELIIFKKGLRGFREFVRIVKSEKIDVVVDLHDDVSTTVSFLVAINKAQNKFGLEKENKKIYTQTVPKLNPVNSHVVNRVLQLAKLFQLKPDFSEVWIKYFPKEESIKLAEKFISNNFSVGKPLLGINISAGSDARFWGVERYKQLIKSLSSYDIEILVLAAPKDKEKLELIGYSKYFLSESFDEFAAIISKLNLLFSPDTAAIHLASAYNVPVFAIYVHDTEEMIWSPLNVDFDFVETREHNMTNIKFEEVWEKFNPFLKRQLR